MSLVSALRVGLHKTRSLFERVSEILSRSEISDVDWEELEETLILADVGYSVAHKVVEQVKSDWNRDKTQNPRHLLINELVRLLDSSNQVTDDKSATLKVIMLVGVNGGGKTTTCGKLAYFYGKKGYRVVIAASDTFRAAAIDQVAIWAKLVEARLVKQKPGADPAAVAYDALNSALKSGDNLVIVDTAGRLHTKKGLMDELGKMVRVLKKLIPEAPHEVLLVLDAITGQNALAQARTFQEAIGLTGLVITKLDGTARGGVVLSIRQELGLPVKFIGIGEGVEDLHPFDPYLYVQALFPN